MHNLPVGWVLFRNEGDKATYLRPGHTVTTPRLAIFSRSEASFTATASSNTLYSVRLINGNVDADGKPIPARSIVEVTVRTPIGIDQSVLDALIADAVTVVSNTEFAQDATVDLMFPGITSAT